MNSFHFRLTMSFLLALALTILPLPAFLLGFRPPWVLLLALFLVFYKPNAVHLSLLFFLGLILDVLLATVMGEHALALLLTTCLASSKQRRFSHYPIGHQMILVGLLSLTYQLIIFCTDFSFGYVNNFLNLFLSSGLSMILWPWIRLLAEDFFITRVKAG